LTDLELKAGAIGVLIDSWHQSSTAQGGMMGKMMGGTTPTTKPTAGTPDEHAAHHH
jgi:hypothetical protein